MNYALIAAILGPLIAAIGGYMIAKRTTSGSIDTTDAATLWKESQAMRQELRDEVVALRKKADTNELEIVALKKENAELKKRVATLEEHDAQK